MNDSQIKAVGPTPLIVEMFIGSLMYSTVTEVRDVLRFVEDTDVDEPATAVLGAVRALALRGTPPGPQLVSDELRRRGRLTRTVGVWLSGATASGACASAAKSYAGAVVAQAFRRDVESYGAALTSMSASASEVDVAATVERAASKIRSIAGRLAELRGDVDE